MIGLLELLIGIAIGLGISDALDDAKPIIPNDSTKVSAEYYIIYQDRYFGRGLGYSWYNDYWWNKSTTNYRYHIDVPKRRYYGISKGKKSGEYTKPKTRKGGERGGKGRHHRGNGNKGKNEN